MQSSNHHISVLKKEAVAALNIQPGGCYADLTLGRAGHAKEIVKALGERGRLYGFDRDLAAIEWAAEVFAGDDRVQLFHSDFAEFGQIMQQLNEPQDFDGVLLDLGVSSPQLDDADRGFSFQRDGRLDMRMDPGSGESAAHWLARVEEKELMRVLFDYGEERFARRIARAIVQTRGESGINSTLHLANIVAQAVPKKEPHKHPATRTFQAIRIFINQELAQLSAVLPQIVARLKKGGRLAVVSFHSLEDRIVKRFIRRLSTPALPPKNIPVSADVYAMPLLSIGRAIKPSAAEVSANARARSSVLRVAERTAVAFDGEGQYA